MNKKSYLILFFLVFFLLSVIIGIRKTSEKSSFLEGKEQKEEKFSFEKYFFYPFFVGDGENKETSDEEAFLQRIENIRTENLQKDIIDKYSGSSEGRENLRETDFHEISSEEKKEILGDEDISEDELSRKKLYLFGNMYLALCTDIYWAGISCTTNLVDPFSIPEGDISSFSGILIKETGENQWHPMSFPKVGSGPISMRIKDGTLFLAMHVIPEGERFGQVDLFAAIYTLRKLLGEGGEWYGWVFEQCYSTAYKEVDAQYLLGENFPLQLSGTIFWDNQLFMEDPLISPKTCFLGNKT